LRTSNYTFPHEILKTVYVIEHEQAYVKFITALNAGLFLFVR